MSTAHYMQFIKGHHGAMDRIGGLPTHLPAVFPVALDGRSMAFLAQFYCAPTRLNLPDTRCIQLYQDRDVGEGGGPWPTAIRVPLDAPLNTANSGTQLPMIKPHDITWETRVDPDSEPASPDDLPLYGSKIGGLCLNMDSFETSDRFLMQLREYPGSFNFAGRKCVVCITADGALKVQLE
jgi:hypothetical protein